MSWGVKYRRGVGVGLSALLASLAIEASALDLDAFQELAPCVTPSETIEATEERLRALGWTTPDTIGDAAIAQLVWPKMTHYFTGDTGGQTLAAIHEIALKSARGLTRKKDIPQAQQRLMIRETGGMIETLHLSRRLPVPYLREDQCDVTLSANSTAELRATLTPEGMFSNHSLSDTVSVTLLDLAALSQTLGREVSADVVIRVWYETRVLK